MRSLLALTLAFVLVPVTQLLADPDTASPAATSGNVETLDNDHQFIEIEVTIAQWATPAVEEQPTDKQLQLEGASQEIADKIAELKSARILSSVQRIRIVAPNRQSAMVQIGMEQPRITGSQFGPRGNSVNSISYSSVGTLVRATPRLLNENRIAVELEVSKSGLATTADAPVLAESASGQTKAEAMRTLTVKTVAAVADGQTIVVSGSTQPSEGELVLLSARLR